MCHILEYENPTNLFYIFHLVLHTIPLFFLSECPSLCQQRPGHSLGKKYIIAQNEKPK